MSNFAPPDDWDDPPATVPARFVANETSKPSRASRFTAAHLRLFEDSDDPIEPRAWLLGTTFCRGYLSALIAAGAAGKTSLRIAQALAMATNRRLTDEYVHRQCRVLLISLEDDKDELKRRVRAARLHHGIPKSETDGWLFLACPTGFKIAMTVDGRVEEGPLVGMIRDAVEQYGIELVIIDPFVKAHGCDENDNNAIDKVTTILTKLAMELNIAIDVVHHISKGIADPGNPDKARGASSFVSAARLVYSLSPMSPEDAATFGVTEEDRRFLIRVDSAKVNVAPRTADAKWYRLASVNLGNQTPQYPFGDSVQACEPWEPPKTWALITPLIANAILDDIDKGTPDGGRYSDANRATDKAWTIVQRHVDSLSEKQCKTVIKTWINTGLLERRDFRQKDDRKTRKGLYVDATKRPGGGP